MKNRRKLYYASMSIVLILGIFNITEIVRSKRIVNVLNHYNEVDKIVIIKDGNRHEIVGSSLNKYKNALEPKNIVSKKNGKEITQKLESEIVKIEYYIQDKKLLESSIYSLSDTLTDNFKNYSFQVNENSYTMVVNKEYRSVNKMDKIFLLEYLE